MTDRRFIRHQHIDSSGKRMQVQCRFCRLKQQYNKYDYVSPCGCVDEGRFVHRDCLQKWVVTKFEHVFNGDYEGDPLEFNVHCQKCEERMEIEFSLVNKCSNYDEFVQNLEQQKLWFLFIIVIAVVVICLLIFLIVFSQSTSSTSIIAILIVLCVVVLILDLVGFFWKFALIQSIQIEKIPNNRDPPKLLAYEADINKIEDEQYEEDKPNHRYGSQPYPKDSYVDKSLMLESKRNSGSQNQDSRVSKTFTDILMKKMYQHDSNVKSNELLVSDHRSRRSRGNSVRPSESYRQKNGNRPEMRDMENQVTIHEHRPMIPLGMTFQGAKLEDKGIQMTVYEPISTPVRSQARNRKRIFQQQLPEEPKLYDNTPQTKPSRVQIQLPPSSESIPIPPTKQKSKSEFPSEIIENSEVQSQHRYNLIRQKPSEISETTPGAGGRDPISQVKQIVSPAEPRPQASRTPERSDNGSTRVKVKKKNPIKIKVAY